jgi:hypothetical protein
MSTSERDEVERKLRKHCTWYNHGTLTWSAAHHFTLFLVPLLAAAATHSA